MPVSRAPSFTGDVVRLLLELSSDFSFPAFCSFLLCSDFLFLFFLYTVYLEVPAFFVLVLVSSTFPEETQLLPHPVLCFHLFIYLFATL